VTAGVFVGLGAAILVLVADLLLPGGARAASNPFDIVELKTYDWRMRRTAKPETARPEIALVEIDEYSLRNLQPNAGRWPWPRAVHSMLIDYLSRAPARVIAYDIDFAEADTRRGFDFGGGSISGAESDAELVDSVKAAGNVLLLADATYEAAQGGGGAPAPDAGIRGDGPGPVDRPVVFPPFPPLAAAAAGVAHNLFVLDPDGPLRHTVPLVRSGGRAIPSFGLLAALRATGISPGDVHVDRETLRIGDRAQPLAWRHVAGATGDQQFLWGLIDFRGEHAYPTYSFFDLEYSEEQILAGVKPKIDPSVFKNKIVFVGATATGLKDAFQTPFAAGEMPGIHIHAAVADDILSNRFLRMAPRRETHATILVTGVLVGMLAVMLPAWWATVLTIALAAAFGWEATRAFAGGYWMNVTQPLATAAVALFGGVAYQYVVEGRERRKMARLFGQFVSKDVFEQLVADPSLARLGGQRRDMTVLFSDIRGFTTVSEKGQPEEIVGMLNEYFTEMVAIVFRHRGTLDKFVGDMVMALFGAPLDDPDHAAHAADTALDMIAALDALNARWTAAGRPALDIGIGISTGPMIAGNIGSDAIMSYTVIGDTVNLGARLESLNKEHGTRIIISETTRERLGPPYRSRPLGAVVVKGKTQSVAIFELVGRA
jgi:adenylate cyclase